jgi:hypothetical protein
MSGILSASQTYRNVAYVCHLATRVGPNSDKCLDIYLSNSESRTQLQSTVNDLQMQFLYEQRYECTSFRETCFTIGECTEKILACYFGVTNNTSMNTKELVHSFVCSSLFCALVATVARLRRTPTRAKHRSGRT